MTRVLALLLCLVSFAGPLSAATYTPPPNAPRVYLPSMGVEVGVWADQTAIGHGIGVFERSGTGPWNLCNWCMAVVEYPTLETVMNEAGGPGPFVASKVAAINDILQRRYPAVMPEPTGSANDKVNGTLAGYALRIVNGSPQIGPR